MQRPSTSHTKIIIPLLFIVTAASIGLTGCVGASEQQVLSTSAIQNAPNTAVAGADVQQTAAQTADQLKTAYRLGAGDKIRLIVFKEPDLSGEFDVDGNGVMSFPLIGQVSAKNLTVRQLEEKVAEKFRKGYLRDPKVSIEVLNYRPFFILGEVKKGGEYPFKAGLTVRDAVAMAGGYTYRANDRKVFIRRANTEVEETHSLSKKVLVNPGDNVRVPERFF